MDDISLRFAHAALLAGSAPPVSGRFDKAREKGFLAQKLGQDAAVTKSPVSATLICKNEEAAIGACLASLDGCAEIIVVDSGSTDSTLDIVRGFVSRGWPIKLFERDWPGYARQKQFAMEQATQDWVLNIDADEWLDEELRRGLPGLLGSAENVSGFRLRLGRFLFGRVEPAPSAVREEYILRLTRRAESRFDPETKVHERPIVDGPVRDARVGYLMHERPLRLDAQIEKEALYARLKAEQRIAAGKRPSLLKLVVNPPLYLFRVFLPNRWFLCGTPGYIHAKTAQIYSFMTEALHFQLYRDSISPKTETSFSFDCEQSEATHAADRPQGGSLSSTRNEGAILPLSATIICKNEGDYIGKCLESLDGFAEIVVVDSGSTDSTLDIVRGFISRGWPIKLIERKWPGYAKQKQFAWEQATRDWVLSIDADEWLDDDLRGALPGLIAAPEEVAGWRLRRPLALYGQEKVAPKNTKPEKIIRLARRTKVRFDESALVHEGLVAEGKVLVAEKGLLRHDRALRMDRQILKEVTYARLKARQRFERGVKPSRLKLIFNPFLYFVRIYFLNRMFLYGVDGYILAGTRATYSSICEALHFQLWLTGKKE
jgi:glycosyltransferase involved in cell wall biosynthesis